MKKSAKPLIVFNVTVFVVITCLILVYIGVKLECEKLTKEKVLAQGRLNDTKNWKINLIAQQQALSSEERIVNIAQDELGMIRRTEVPTVLTVSKEKIEKISNAINKKYE